jgi:phage repressor protein C with HTH and peptisase S24 domain
MVMNHSEVWGMIDEFASYNSKSVSGLAKLAGLDATTFNKSKRFTKEGQERWPSTHSVSKIMTATNCTLNDLVRIYLKNKKKFSISCDCAD